MSDPAALDAEIDASLGRGDLRGAATQALRGYGPQIVGTVTGAHAAPVTLRLVPQDAS